MITQKEQLWRQLPPPVIPMPVFALAADRRGLWAGGVGGVAFAEAAETPCTWQPGGTALPLASVTALLALDGVLLAGGGEGLAYSFNGGRNWQQAQLEDGLASITALAASPNFAQDQTVLAATLEHGLLRSSDGGRTWLNASFGLESLEVNALAWFADNMLLAATSVGIYRSRDAGRAWRCLYASEDSAVEALAILPGGLLLAALANGAVLRSLNAGKDWQSSYQAADASLLSLYATARGTLLLGTSAGLLRSDDAGANWHAVSEQGVHICVQNADQIYVGSESGVSVSEDDGRTWRDLPCPPLHDLRLLLASSEHLLLAGTYAGLVESTSAGHWHPLAHLRPPLSACRLISADTLLFANSEGLQSCSLANGACQMLRAGAAGQVAHLALRRTGERCQLWMARTDGSGLRYSPDGGTNWRQLSSPFGILPLVALEAVADRLLAATYDPRQYQVCLWYSTDDGQSWVRSLEAGTRWPLVTTCAQPAAVSIGNLLFLEHAAGKWQKITVGHDGGAIRRVVSSSQVGQIVLYVLTTTGLLVSDDLGMSWRQENAGLPVDHVLDLALVGSSLTVLLSGGRVWQRELPGV